MGLLFPKYIILPQVPMTGIIDKLYGQYANELFRIIDFGVFSINFEPLLMIEINDLSHNNAIRYSRDVKISQICQEAGINLAFFFTKDKYQITKIQDCFRYFNLI